MAEPEALPVGGSRRRPVSATGSQRGRAATRASAAARAAPGKGREGGGGVGGVSLSRRPRRRAAREDAMGACVGASRSARGSSCSSIGIGCGRDSRGAILRHHEGPPRCPRRRRAGWPAGVGVPARLPAGVDERRVLGGGEEAEEDTLAANRHRQLVLPAAFLRFVVWPPAVGGEGSSPRLLLIPGRVLIYVTTSDRTLGLVSGAAGSSFLEWPWVWGAGGRLLRQRRRAAACPRLLVLKVLALTCQPPE